MASNMLEWADAPEGETKLTFVEKERRVKDIMKDSIVNAENQVVCFSGGKKSLVLMHLIKRGYEGALNVLHIDTEFEKIYLYIEKMRKLWRFRLISESQNDIEDMRIAENKEECCKKLIIEPLKNAIVEYKIDCLFVGGARDENEDKKFVSAEDDYYVRIKSYI